MGHKTYYYQSDREQGKLLMVSNAATKVGAHAQGDQVKVQAHYEIWDNVA